MPIPPFFMCDKNFEEMEKRIAALEDRAEIYQDWNQGKIYWLIESIEDLWKCLLALQPKYHTLLYTFNNVHEANAAWTMLQLLKPENEERAKQDLPMKIPPMPVGDQFTSPWQHKDKSPALADYSELPTTNTFRLGLDKEQHGRITTNR